MWSNNKLTLGIKRGYTVEYCVCGFASNFEGKGTVYTTPERDRGSEVYMFGVEPTGPEDRILVRTPDVKKVWDKSGELVWDETTPEETAGR